MQRACQTTAVVSLLNSKAVGARRTLCCRNCRSQFQQLDRCFMPVAPVGQPWERRDCGSEKSNRNNQPKDKDHSNEGCNFGFCHGVSPPSVRPDCCRGCVHSLLRAWPPGGTSAYKRRCRLVQSELHPSDFSSSRFHGHGWT